MPTIDSPNLVYYHTHYNNENMKIHSFERNVKNG